MTTTAQTDHGDVTPTTGPPASSWTCSVEQVVRALQSALAPSVDSETIRLEVEREFAQFSDVRIREFVPLLVENRVRSRHAHEFA